MSTEENEPRAHGFAFALPMSDEILMEQERRRMASEDKEATVYRFFDGLNIEQLMTLRTLFNQRDAEKMNQYFDGQIVTLLRCVHGVDPNTGLTPQEALERAAQASLQHRRPACAPPADQPGGALNSTVGGRPCSTMTAISVRSSAPPAAAE